MSTIDATESELIITEKLAPPKKRQRSAVSGGPGDHPSIPGRIVGGIVVILLFIIPYVVMLLGSL